MEIVKPWKFLLVEETFKENLSCKTLGNQVYLEIIETRTNINSHLDKANFGKRCVDFCCFKVVSYTNQYLNGYGSVPDVQNLLKWSHLSSTGYEQNLTTLLECLLTPIK
jgi:hypothetical protein